MKYSILTEREQASMRRDRVTQLEREHYANTLAVGELMAVKDLDQAAQERVAALTQNLVEIESAHDSIVAHGIDVPALPEVETVEALAIIDGVDVMKLLEEHKTGKWITNSIGEDAKSDDSPPF